MKIWGVTPKSFSNLLSNLVPSLLLLKWELLFNSWVKTLDVRMEQSWAAGKPQSLYPQSMIYPCWFHAVFPYHTLKLPVGDFLNSRLINHCPIKSFIGDFLASHVCLPTGKWTFFRDHPTIRGNKPFTARWCPILSNIGIGLHLG